MEVFKVTGPSREKIIVVSCTSMHELISNACNRLKLPLDCAYKIVLEEDGAEVEEFETMVLVAKKYPVKFMILPENDQWEKQQPTSFCYDISPRIFTGAENPACESLLSTPTSSNTWASKMTATSSSKPFAAPLIWEKIIPARFQNVATNSSVETLQLIKNLADHLYSTNCTSHSDALKLAKEVVAKFPKAFEHKTWNGDEFQVYSNGVRALRARIYERLKYLNKGQKRKRNNDANSSEDLNQNRKKNLKRYAKDQDTYGCVAYEPAIPDSETIESQESKKNLLLNLFKENEITDTSIVQILNDTYASQRMSINRRKAKGLTLKEVLDSHWPHLTEEKHFLAHADVLLGKKTQEVWNTNLELKIPKLISYFKSYCMQYRKKKYIPTVVSKMKKHFDAADKASEELKSSSPSIISFLPLISSKFYEAELFTVVDPATSDEEVRKIGDSSRPILIIKGMSLYDEAISCMVVIEQEIVLRTNFVTQGILLMLLTFYVYGYNYPATNSSSFEFIQRMLLDINPELGHKRGRKNYKDDRDPKAGSLIDHFVEFLSHC